ncbi:hypothetical protein PFICI_03597 [Pestalotiopsis fici W106-1]|uniref:2EXR domain-containing protein n=1 Tax=Pestalotiopsis fici (strain W106-1 / CGMCC3.15140) TaxID=1229662 RepID=W3XJD7_PESFW|nr:uncharacterized protein PFICI_03597 [Pestalotiopsis fici W106-1]ETS85572.1 hypothetical protein PFICI_03597 [Pestalotiopsis fici W106-1]
MAQVFHQFNYLPAEIRASIWELAVDTQQRIITTCDGIKILKAPTPPLFLVSHEAKECAMRQYRRHPNEYRQYPDGGCIQTSDACAAMTAESRDKGPYFAPKYDILLLLPGTADGFGDAIWRRLLGMPRVAFRSLQHANMIFGQISPSNASETSAVRAICASNITELWILNDEQHHHHKDGGGGGDDGDANSAVRWSRKLPKYWLHPHCEVESANGDDCQDADGAFRHLLRMNGFARDERRHGPPIL